MMYYRNPEASELTSAGIDSRHFFTGKASEKEKQDIFEKLQLVFREVVEPMRLMGYKFYIGRSYSEGAYNHGTGYTLDLVPYEGSFDAAYGLATAVATLNKCEQVWIEASNNIGIFHVHVRLDPSLKNSSPMLYTILDYKGQKSEPGLVYYTETIENAEEKAKL